MEKGGKVRAACVEVHRRGDSPGIETDCDFWQQQRILGHERVFTGSAPAFTGSTVISVEHQTQGTVMVGIIVAVRYAGR